MDRTRLGGEIGNQACRKTLKKHKRIFMILMISGISRIHYFRYVPLDSRRIEKGNFFQKPQTVNLEHEFTVFAQNGECGDFWKTQREHKIIKKSVARAYILIGSVFGKCVSMCAINLGGKLIVFERNAACANFSEKVFSSDSSRNRWLEHGSRKFNFLKLNTARAVSTKPNVFSLQIDRTRGHDTSG